MVRPTRATEARKLERSAQVLADLPKPGSYQAFMPKVDDKLVVQFPGETMRVPVKQIVDADTVLIHIDTVPMAKTHQFQFDKVYGCRRRIKDGRDVWEAQYEREFLDEQRRMTPAPKRPAPMKKAAAKKKGRR